ncbi:DUF4238 domain-containing protein [Myroides ceti]|uniref:DUF4238 domain-containing protein n=1 Tax=Paenimyroides ceti TaxID=395087 RepID=A0ABT8CTS4_9FLAO|nr:DUF4238 domain-containing protein [Paenimyroides ceti]MDN3707166.1 DUF4238 domain-containing protein [Paenimyroides ceti]
MSNLKKRQHYVWRHYLRPWSENESVWTYLKEQDKVLNTGLMNVAQEKYFYELEDFTHEEISFLKKIVDKSHPSLKALNEDFLLIFTSTSILKIQLAKVSNPNHKKVLEAKIREVEVNSMEEIHSYIENLGSKIIQCRSLKDLKDLDTDDNLFSAIMFLCVQYFRTKNMRKSIETSFMGEKLEKLAKKSWSFMSFTMATNLSRNILFDEKLRFIFIENNTTTPFITCDQPVFNILNDKLNDNGEVVEMELYYPLTSKCSFYLHFRPTQIDRFESMIADEDYVTYLNRKVFENASYYVFSDNKHVLEQIRRNE